MMSKNILDKMEKWHSFCALKGIDVEENFYSIVEIMSIIDRLQAEIEENDSFYRAALEGRRMQIDRNQIEWYKDHLEKIYEEKREAKEAQDEIENPILKKLREQNDFAFTKDDSQHSKAKFDLLKGKEKISVSLEVTEQRSWHSSDRWKITYSWFDQGLTHTRMISWNPRKKSLKCPDWFPVHWKNFKNIPEANQVAFFVAWKLVTGKAKHMGGSPYHTKVSHSLKPIEDLDFSSAV